MEEKKIPPADRQRDTEEEENNGPTPPAAEPTRKHADHPHDKPTY